MFRIKRCCALLASNFVKFHRQTLQTSASLSTHTHCDCKSSHSDRKKRLRYFSSNNNNNNPNNRSELYKHLLLEKYEDPLKRDFDLRMHRHFGSLNAIKLSKTDKERLMPNDNLCVLLKDLEQLEIYNLEKPEIIEPWEILLEILNVGVCGSDFEWYKSGKIGPIKLKQPMIMGHETGARVIALGAAAKEENNIKEGDIVALEPGLACMECDACTSGSYNLCSRVCFFATPPVHGTMRRYMKHHYKYCYKVASGTDAKNEGNIQKYGELAALCEPLSVGIHAAGKYIAKVKNGDFVGIFGAGPIGIINMLCCIYYGADKIFITDVNDAKLKIVKDYIAANKKVLDGIQIVPINTAKTPLSNDYLSETFNVNDGRVDHAFECVGNEFVLNDCLKYTKSGGMTTVIGMAADLNMKIDVGSFNIEEKTLNGVFRYRYSYPTAVDMMVNNKIGDARNLITSRLNPWNEKELEQGFQTIAQNMKIMFEF